MKEKDNKNFWDRWAKWYDFMMSKDGRTYAQIVGYIKKKLNREMAVLELACGTGLLSVQLAGSVKLLEATDFSEEMIRQAKEKTHSSRLHFSVQDATSLPYTPGTFDAVVISNALHIMPEPEKAMAEIRRVLKPGGLLIAPTFTAAGNLSGRMKIRLMELSGFKVFHKWISGFFKGKWVSDYKKQNIWRRTEAYLCRSENHITGECQVEKSADVIFFNRDLCRRVTNPMIADEKSLLRISHRSSVAKHTA